MLSDKITRSYALWEIALERPQFPGWGGQLTDPKNRQPVFAAGHGDPTAGATKLELPWILGAAQDNQ